METTSFINVKPTTTIGTLAKSIDTYGMLMTLIFRNFGVLMEKESRDNEILSGGAKNVFALKLNPQPRMESACTYFDKKDAQKNEDKK